MCNKQNMRKLCLKKFAAKILFPYEKFRLQFLLALYSSYFILLYTYPQYT